MRKLTLLDPPPQMSIDALVWAWLGAWVTHRSTSSSSLEGGQVSQSSASRTGERHPGSVALSRRDWPAVVYRSERHLDRVCAERSAWSSHCTRRRGGPDDVQTRHFRYRPRCRR